jgi:hypothetical protein
MRSYVCIVHTESPAVAVGGGALAIVPSDKPTASGDLETVGSSFLQRKWWRLLATQPQMPTSGGWPKARSEDCDSFET